MGHCFIFPQAVLPLSVCPAFLQSVHFIGMTYQTGCAAVHFRPLMEQNFRTLPGICASFRWVGRRVYRSHDLRFPAQYSFC